jgi:hypothetical protein
MLTASDVTSQWYRELPSIGSCLLIDSRFSSRRSFLDGLRSTKLFLDVIEAESIEDARDRLIGGWFDACLIGPSLKSGTCESLVASTQGKMPSSKCAFIVFTNSQEHTSNEVLKWAHRVGQIPGSTMELAEALVVAVLSANSQSIWKDTVLEIRPDLVHQAIQATALKQQLLLSRKDRSVSGVAREFSVDAIMTLTYSVLDKLIEEYSGERSALGPDGGVRQEAVRDVRNATDALFDGFIVTPQLNSYKKYFATTLLEALIRVAMEGKEQAVKEFRKSILKKR